MYRMEVAYTDPDLFDQLGNDFDVEQDKLDEHFLELTLYNDDIVTIPVKYILYTIVHD